MDFAYLELSAAEVANELWKHVSGHVHRSATLTAVGGCIVPQVLASASHTPASEVSRRLIVRIVELPKLGQFVLVGDILVAHDCLLSRGIKVQTKMDNTIILLNYQTKTKKKLAEFSFKNHYKKNLPTSGNLTILKNALGRNCPRMLSGDPAFF